ncbi:MAG: helix-turn-helix transcriptional regulator [Coriobacteriales bacterium]|nr:helix-turn-helix transcriptional regulator [Coriobacteriales bacterium]
MQNFVVYWNKLCHINISFSSLGLLPFIFYGSAFIQRGIFYMTTTNPLYSLDFILGTATSSQGILIRIIALIGVIVVVHKRESLLKYGFLALLAAVLLTVSVLFYSSGPHPSWAGPLCLISIYVNSAVLFVFWLELFGMLPPFKMVIALAGSLFFNALLIAAMNSAQTHFITRYVFLIFPIACALCLTLCHITMTKTSGNTICQPPSYSKFFKRIVIGTALFAFVFGFTSSGLAANTLDVGSLLYGQILASVPLVLAAMTGFKHWGLHTYYKYSIACLALGILAVYIFNAPGQVSGIFLTAGMNGCLTLALILCCGDAFRCQSSAVPTCAIILLTHAVSAGIGLYFASYISTSILCAPIAICCFLVLLLYIALLFVLKENHLKSSYTNLAVQLSQYGEEALNTLTQYCDMPPYLLAFAYTHHLTPSEVEIMRALLEGKTQKEIAQERFIAYSTLRAHVCHIYKKLGISSRDDLVLLAKNAVI